jgi:hypothetical protein
MRKSLFAVVLLVMLFTVSPTALAAPPERVTMTGVGDLLGGQVGGDLVPDAAGHLHLRQAAFRGSFALEGGGISIKGAEVIVLNGVLDATLSGPVAGTLTIATGITPESTTLWQGTIHGRVNALIFTGQAVAHGVGPYAGQHLKLTYQERPATPGNPNPEIFDLTGVLSGRR